MGDLRAQHAGCLTGERKLQELIGRYGAGTVEEACREILDHSERLTRAEIAKIPDGAYTCIEYADGDGMSDEPVRIQVALTVRGTEIVVDFSGTSLQTVGGMNAPYAVTYSAVQFAVRCVTDPWNPANSGCYRPVSVVAPLGSVVNPRLPASVIAGNVETASTIVDAVMGALAQAAPDRVIAAGSGTAGNVVLGGKDVRPGRGERQFVYLESCGGCWGARPDADGINGMRYSIGNTGNGPIEVVETEYPVQILSYSLVQDAGGAGTFRGGLPVRRVFRLVGDAVFTLAAEKSRFQPSGLFGGQRGAVGRYVLISGEREERLFSKTRPMPLRTGDILDVQPPGAGGYGDPHARDAELVAWDVREGYVSREQARAAYGVSVNVDGTVDPAATARLRGEGKPRAPGWAVLNQGEAPG